MQEIFGLQIRELARRVREGEVSPVEVVEAHLAAVDERNESVNALIHVDRSGALDRARALERDIKKGVAQGRLSGVVFSAKESFDVEGMPVGLGSEVIPSRTATRNCAVVQKLLDEGAICIGKSNQPEYGKAYITDNRPYGRTSNPINLHYSPGGSSGGDAAAVAAGFASFGLCSDSGGSVRIPANFCGLFGLYPSAGMFSDAGQSFPPTTASTYFRRTGFVARSADDTSLLFEVLRGYDSRDPLSRTIPLRESDPPRRAFRFFSSIGELTSHPEIKGQLSACVEKLVAAGFSANEGTPKQFESTLDPFLCLAVQGATTLQDALADEETAKRRKKVESLVHKELRSRIKSELPSLTPERLLTEWYKVDALRFGCHRMFDDVDFLLAPVAAVPVFQHGVTSVELDGKQCGHEVLFRFSSAVNVLGLTAVAFPTGTTAEGLPLGLQVIGPPGSDRMLISIAGKLRGW